MTIYTRENIQPEQFSYRRLLRRTIHVNQSGNGEKSSAQGSPNSLEIGAPNDAKSRPLTSHKHGNDTLWQAVQSQRHSPGITRTDGLVTAEPNSLWYILEAKLLQGHESAEGVLYC